MSDVERPWDAPKPKPEKGGGSGGSNIDVPWGKVALAAVAVLIVLAFAGVFSGGEDTDGDEFGAKAICQSFVEKRLKAPGTADFSQEVATQDGMEWTVTGVVDSENSFGGEVRNGYNCVVTYQGDDRWGLRNLTTDGN